MAVPLKNGIESLVPTVRFKADGTGDPITGTSLTNSATAAAGAMTATLTSAAGKTAWIDGFEITGGGATAASIISVTVTGTLGGTLNYRIVVPAGATTTITPLIVEFPNPIPASATNTNIVVNVPSFGAGNTQAAVVAHGFLI